ncbi:hypothetical protein NIES2101_26265 [Calothrix sp. HK-06]|nr:hypothetical protein NIES2101_26265 [Calothrix sp. HK-06]
MESLKLGSKGLLVKILQSYLKVLQPNVIKNISDTFDATTKTAVENFQRSAGLKVDGEVGDKTWETLIKRFEPIWNQTDSEFQEILKQINTAKDNANIAISDVNKAITGATENLEKINNAVKSIDDAKNTSVKTIDYAKDDAVELINAAKDRVIQDVEDSRDNAIEKVNESKQNVIKDIDAAEDKGVKGVNGARDSAVQKVNLATENKIQEINSAKDTAVAKVKEEVEPVLNRVVEAQTTILEARKTAQIQAYRAKASASLIKAKESARGASIKLAEATNIYNQIKGLRNAVESLVKQAGESAAKASSKLSAEKAKASDEAAKQAIEQDKLAKQELETAETNFTIIGNEVKNTETAVQDVENQEKESQKLTELDTLKSSVDNISEKEEEAKAAYGRINEPLEKLKLIPNKIEEIKQEVDKLAKAAESGLDVPKIPTPVENPNFKNIWELFDKNTNTTSIGEKKKKELPPDETNWDEFEDFFDLKIKEIKGSA